MAVAPAGDAGRQIRLLWWLKLRLSLRGMQRSRATLVGMILAGVFLLPFALGLAVVVFVGLARNEPPIAELILRGGLLAVGTAWLFAPLLGFSLNESYDITRLFLYPVPLRRIFVGTILGSLADLSTLLLLPSLLAAVAGVAFHGFAAGLVAAVALALFLFLTLSLSQAALLATAGILKSRKFRDIALVVVPLFWMTYQIAQQAFFGRIGKGEGEWRSVAQSPWWEVAGYFPPGLAARAIAGAMKGLPLTVAGSLGLLALLTAGTIALAGWLVAKAYEGEEIGPQPAKAAAGAPAAAQGPRFSLAGLPSTVAGVLWKERTYYARDPYYRLVLMNVIYALGFTAFMVFSRTGRPSLTGEVTEYILWGATALTLLQQSALLYNQFGADGLAAPLLFSFPVSRRHLLIGKNLALYAGAAAIDAAISLLICAIARRPALFPWLLAWTLLASAVMVAIGNLMSVFFPFRIRMTGFRTRQSGGSGIGCAFGFLYLAVSLAAGLLYLPVLAALWVPKLYRSAAWLGLTLPLAVVYVGFLYWISLGIGAGFLLQREALVIEKLTRTESA